MNPFSLYSNAVRAKEIVTTLGRYGFIDLLKMIDAPVGWLGKVIPQSEKHLSQWERFRRAIEELGPTFVKFGQALSARPDILPAELILELKRLRNDVKPVPFLQMEPVVIHEIGGPIDSVFTDFDPNPIACGSLGQVYKARLRHDGSPVAVKVQRPNIEAAIYADLEIVSWFARQMDQHVKDLKPYDLPNVVAEMRRGLLEELDFRVEGRNVNLFNQQNPYPDKVFAPKVFDRYTTNRLLVMEWVDGEDLDKVQLEPEVAKELARNGATSVFHQIMVDGFFHADPHTGNILVTRDLRLCLIDWGLVGLLTRQMRHDLADLISAVTHHNADKVVKVVDRMTPLDLRVEEQKLEKAVTIVISKYNDFKTGKENIGQVMMELLYAFGSNGIHLAQDFTMLAKATISIEEAATRLDPNFDLQPIADSYTRRLTWERYNPDKMFERGAWGFVNVMGKLGAIPGGVARIVRKLEDDKLCVNFEHRGLEQLDDSINSSSSRLSVAVILASMLIASSLVIRTEKPPFLFGYNALGIIGYLFAGLLGVWIVVDIIRHGRHK